MCVRHCLRFSNAGSRRGGQHGLTGNWTHVSAAIRADTSASDFTAAAKAWKRADGAPRAAGIVEHERSSEIAAPIWLACPSCRKAI